jgi:hypothetical protein
MKKMTKIEMVKDIFYEATKGKRCAANFIDGMFLIETIAKHNYKWAIERWWNEVNEGRIAYWTLNEMVTQTIHNTYNSNCMPTPTTARVREAFHTFKQH